MINKIFKGFSILTVLLIFIMQSTIVHAQIKDNQTVDPSKVWTIKFSQEVQLDDLGKQVITVKDSKMNLADVTLTLGQDSKSVLVNPPIGGYTAGEKYTLSIGNGLKSKGGKTLKSAIAMNFSISTISDPRLTILISPKYDSEGYFSEGLAVVHNTSGFSYIDTNGKVKIGPIKSMVFRENDGYGEILSSDHEVEYATNFHEGLAFLHKYSDYPVPQIVIDNEGNEVFQSVDVVGDMVMSSFMDGISVAQILGVACQNPSLVDKKGNTTRLDMNGITKHDYNRYDGYAEGLLKYLSQVDGKSGYVDIKTNKIVIKPQFEASRIFNKGIAPAKLDGKWGFIDKTGKFVINPQYDDFFVNDINYSYQVFTNDNIASVKKNGKWGTIDKSGNVIIDFKYNNPLIFNDGMAVVEVDGKYGYIDIQGKEMIKPQYDDANYFNKNIALVGENDTYYLIDKDNKKIGTETWNFQGTSVSKETLDIVFYKQNEKWGMAKISY